MDSPNFDRYFNLVRNISKGQILLDEQKKSLQMSQCLLIVHQQKSGSSGESKTDIHAQGQLLFQQRDVKRAQNVHSFMQYKMLPAFLFFCHLTWLLNKASTAVSANALKGKHNCQSSFPRGYDFVTQTAVTERRQISESHLGPSRHPTYQSILQSYPHPGYRLVSRTHFYIYEITNSGLWNPKCPDVEPVGNRLLMQTLFQCQQ